VVDNEVDYAKLIEDMERAEGAPEPGNFIPYKEIIHKGDAELPVSIVAGSLKSAGYVYVYHLETGERRAVNRNMLPSILRKRLPTGELAFSTRPVLDPLRPYKEGELRCWLHKDGEYREIADEWALPFCPKKNLKTPIDVLRHMQHRHRSEYEAINTMLNTKKEDEEREWRRALVGLAAAKGKGKNE